MTNNDRIGFKVSTEQKKQFKTLCKENDTSMGKVLREFIRRTILTNTIELTLKFSE